MLEYFKHQKMIIHLINLFMIIIIGCYSKSPTENENSEDVDPPDVEITSPAQGATLSGVVNIKAEATDNVGVKQVSIYINGNHVKDGDSYGWDTMYTYDQVHTIYAKAWDDAGNEGISGTISITTANSIPLNVNYIANPGFESGKTGWGGDPPTVCGTSHSGNCCARLNQYDEGMGTTILFHFERTQRFKLSFWHKGAGGEIGIYGQGCQAVISSFPSSSQNWSCFEFEFNTVGAVGKFHQLRINGGGNEVFIDDVSFIRIN